ncbi:MAG: metal ABC transporter permease [Candidatus Woesearchaeota archaeon]|nr:metal ABC transporter permease [Candidatus Woesearchaeota archaeon]|tara:strand:- start:2305 stop:3417 length:1113 start_codon:yes stop_codon:yes gene_type:complete
MLPPQADILILATIVSVTCALPGVFLVLRGMSLMSDAISHSILLGIVLGFFLIRDISSPFLIIGAALVGILTVALTEVIIKTRKLKEDAAIGLVFPVLFSIGVILINRYARNVHLDSDSVLLGEIGLAPFNRLSINQVDLGPVSWWVMGAILLVNLVVILSFYKEIKIATFDAALSTALGFSPALIHYGIMSMVSITAVGAFDSVGSILVVALIIAPPSAAFLLTKKLSTMLILSAFIGILSSITGFFLARAVDASIAGSMAMMTGIFFLLALLLAPEHGLIAKFWTRNKRKYIFAAQMLVVHLLDHEGKPEESEENTFTNSLIHMRWSEKFAKKVVSRSVKDGLMADQSGKLKLTSLGRETARKVMTMT